MEPLRSHTPKGARARESILRRSEKLFVASGFHGASMRDVAEACGLPLASVIYHFARKEKLYAAVLDRIGEDISVRIERALEDEDRPWAARLDAVVRALLAWTTAHAGRVKLLLRELLDNPARVAHASRLPLGPVLLRLASFVEAGMRASAFRRVVAETSVLHLVGAISYVVAARPTVRRIVGAARDRRMTASYEREAIALARRTFLALEPEVRLHESDELSRWEPRDTSDRAGGPRARPRRRAHDGHGRRPKPHDTGDRGLPRR